MKLKTRYLIVPAFLLLFFPRVGSAEEGFRLVCDKPVYKFGQVTQSAVITNVFTVRNEGDLTFKLKYIRASCGCTKGRLSKRMIGPGESAELTATFKAARRRGSQKKKLRIIPIDSAEPALILYMEGFIETPVESR